MEFRNRKQQQKPKLLSLLFIIYPIGIVQHLLQTDRFVVLETLPILSQENAMTLHIILDLVLTVYPNTEAILMS